MAKGLLNIDSLRVGPVATNCYIVYDENNVGFILDPGDNADSILNKVIELKLDIKAILLTHGHFDHIAAVDDIKKKLDVDVVISKTDANIVKDPTANVSRYFNDILVVATVTRLVSDNETMKIGNMDILVIETPGHTSGSVCYLVSNTDEKALFSGDTLFRDTHGRCDLPTGSEASIIHSIKDKLLVLSEDIDVFPGHGGPTTIGDERYNY